MYKLYKSNSKTIGNTPIIYLNNIEPKTILVKIESKNPSFSIKCRIGMSMLLDIKQANILKSPINLMEPTSGNTGIALAYIAAIYNYKIVLIMPESMSIERQKLLKALGVKLILTAGIKGMKGTIYKTKKLIKRNPKRYLILDQFNNPSNFKTHETTTSFEIWNSTKDSIAMLISGVGTGGTITGISRYFKKLKGIPISIVAVEPIESPIISQSITYIQPSPSQHEIQGIGAGFIPNSLDSYYINKVVKVKSKQAIFNARLLINKEGIIAGISSGAVIAAAIKLHNKQPIKRKAVIILPSSGERYLSTKLFNRF
ncbi:cysteine synthase A [Candidatus Tremblaya phenacola]|nr:cysteine synthase A [Candidatus Tremblaya phenacola]